MADLTITASAVKKGTGATLVRDYVAGEAVTEGQTVYLGADSKWYKAKANGTAAQAQAQGVALHAASADQPLAVQTGGQVTIGATIAAGVFYYVSPTNAGGVCPIADLASGNYPSIIGYGISTTVLVVAPVIPGVALA